MDNCKKYDLFYNKDPLCRHPDPPAGPVWGQEAQEARGGDQRPRGGHRQGHCRSNQLLFD